MSYDNSVYFHTIIAYVFYHNVVIFMIKLHLFKQGNKRTKNKNNTIQHLLISLTLIVSYVSIMYLLDIIFLENCMNHYINICGNTSIREIGVNMAWKKL